MKCCADKFDALLTKNDISENMETKFKTNVKCAGCVATVTPFLNEAVGKNNWRVDYNDPSKILTVTGEPDNRKVIEALQKAGYKAESLQS